MVRGDLGIGVVVAGGKKHLGFQLLQHLIKGLDGLRPDPLAVEEVPGQEDQVGLALPAASARRVRSWRWAPAGRSAAWSGGRAWKGESK